MDKTANTLIEEKKKNGNERTEDECCPGCAACCEIPCDICCDTCFTTGLNCFCLTIGGFFECIFHALCACCGE